VASKRAHRVPALTGHDRQAGIDRLSTFQVQALDTKEGPNQHHQGIRLGPQRRDYLSSAAKRRYKSTISPAKSRKVMAFIMWSCE